MIYYIVSLYDSTTFISVSKGLILSFSSVVGGHYRVDTSVLEESNGLVIILTEFSDLRMFHWVEMS